MEVRQMTIGERLIEIRGHATQGAFAKELDISVQTLGRYEREERPPDADFLLKLRQKMGINPDWLLTGEGAREVGRVAEEAGAYSVSDGFVRLPLYPNITVHAGGGALVEADAEKAVEMRSFSPHWIRHELHANPADLVLMYVEGDSMDDGRDGLRPGDVMIVNKTDTDALKDGVYVLRVDDALMVKRLQRLPGERLRVISDNPAYQAFEVDLKGRSGSLQIIGRVVYAWGGRRF